MTQFAQISRIWRVKPHLMSLTKFFYKTINLLLPDTCMLCRMVVDDPAPHLCCTHCWSSLARFELQCRHCGRPLPTDGVGDLICGACQTNPLTLGLTIAPLVYAEEAVDLVHALKFSNSLRAARTLSCALSERILSTATQLPKAIVPTPISWRRHFRRGYNQSDRLAHELATRLELPIRYPLRRRHGTVQHGNSRAQREAQPMKVFTIAESDLPDHIALVDDVITTGTTMKNMSKTLARAGVQRVDLWAPCRASSDF
ncbi:MAG: hypothetical protein GKR90_20250 [Pseudomonadales bacterium]|nr:hypothetical protein [Pseudomonadales bacterium]